MAGNPNADNRACAEGGAVAWGDTIVDEFEQDGLVLFVAPTAANEG